ncbi:hypothetical protein SHIRM173S_11293 [Streptomyces hirsutus]
MTGPPAPGDRAAVPATDGGVRTAAIGLSGMEKTAPAPVSLYRTAGHAVSGHGPDGLRAAVHLVIDHSGS